MVGRSLRRIVQHVGELALLFPGMVREGEPLLGAPAPHLALDILPALRIETAVLGEIGRLGREREAAPRRLDHLLDA